MKLAIAAALSHRARLLILDEATAGLDPIVRDEVVEVFREFVCDDDHSILICLPYCQRPGEAVRLRGLSPQGPPAVLRREGRAAGALRSAELHRRSAGRAGAQRRAGQRALALRGGGAGAARRRARRVRAEKPTLEDIILFQVKGEKHT